jgi:hypothetical protein
VKTNEEQVFDLSADPREMEDISGNAAILAPLRETMARYLSGRKDYTHDPAWLKPLRNAPPAAFWRVPPSV